MPGINTSVYFSLGMLSTIATSNMGDSSTSRVMLVDLFKNAVSFFMVVSYGINVKNAAMVFRISRFLG